MLLRIWILLVLSPVEIRADMNRDWARMAAIPPKGYVCYRAPKPPAIDGNLDEAAWQAAAWTADFEDIEGKPKPAPRYRTRAKMLWDDEFFYIGAWLEEPHVWAVLTRHDEVIFQDNDFEIFIDPNGDNHEYYEIEINALNTVWDLFLPIPYKDGGKAQNEWEIPGLRTAVRVAGTLNRPGDQDQGWSVEIAIPWSVLARHAHRPAPPKSGDQWRVNFSRVEWMIDTSESKYRKVPGKKEDNWVWSPQGIVDMHRPEQWGYVQFSTRRSGRDQVKPDPATAVRSSLIGIYYAEREIHAKTGKYTDAESALGLSGQNRQAEVAFPKILLTPDGFEASLALRSKRGKIYIWHIRQDSKLWSE